MEQSSGGAIRDPDLGKRRVARLRPRPAVWACVLLLQAGAAAGQPAAQPPPAVTTAVVEARDVTPTAEFVGRVEAIQAFDARARVEGFLRKVAFQEGGDIESGDLLYVIEPAPYEAQLASARAQLEQARARLREAERALARARELRERGNISEAALDEALAAQEVAQAEVLAAEATVQTAELNLSYTRIASPIDGRIGATAVTEGNLVGPGSDVLATVVQLEPIRVVFSVSSRDLLSVMRQFDARSPSELVDRFVPKLRLPTRDIYPHAGRIEFVSNRIDPATGTVAVRAAFPNPDRVLLPGQFATILVQPEEIERRPVVPVAAVQRDREGAYVLVLDDADRVLQRRVETGIQVDQQIVIEDGLQEGETVIVAGQQKVRPGMTVQPTPAAAAAPG